jgi:uncharacterized membrane protein
MQRGPGLLQDEGSAGLVEKIIFVLKIALTKLKLLVGWVMVALGIPIFVLPIPLGIFIIIGGLLMIFSASPPARAYVIRKVRRHPFLQRRLLPLLGANRPRAQLSRRTRRCRF